jgi:hypothetical protein
VPCERSAECLASDRAAKFGGTQAERLSKGGREMTVVREAELVGQGVQPRARVGQPIERGTKPQLVAVAEQREARLGAKDAAELETRDAEYAAMSVMVRCSRNRAMRSCFVWSTISR